MALLSGIHPVAEALRAGNPIERVVIAQGAGGPRLQEIIDLARRAGVPVRFEPRGAIDKLANTSAHQGVIALGAARKYADLESVAGSELLVVLDGVEDPHNLGAIVRTAHAAGAGAIIIPERRAVGITDVVAKAAAGALEHLPVVRVTNINRTLEELKRQGMTAGVGDISGVSPAGLYCELELKTATGRLSPAQRKRQDELRETGVVVVTCYGLDEALAILERWGAIR